MGGKYVTQKKRHGKGRRWTILLLAVAILAAGIAGVYLFGDQNTPTVPESLAEQSTAVIPQSAEVPVTQIRLQADPAAADPEPMPEDTVEEAPAEPAREQLYQVPEIRFYNTESTRMDEYVGVSIKIIDVYGDVVLEDDECQWRFHGNSTKKVDKKPYKFKLSSEQDLFGMGSANKWILLANAFDKTLLRNKLIFDLAAAMGIPYTSSSTFVEVYVDDYYRGSYLLIEPAEIDKERVNLRSSQNEFLLELEQPFREHEDEILITPYLNIPLGVNNLDYLPEDQRTYLEDLFEKAETALLTHDQEQIEAYFNIESFVNMYVINEFTKNADTHIASTRFYVKDGIIHAGPPWDYDLSCGNEDENSDRRHRWNDTRPSRTDGWYACSLWWDELCDCEWFMGKFAQRYLELQPLLVNIYQENELGASRIDSLIASISDSIDHNFSKWSVSIRIYHLERVSSPTYELNVEHLRTWLQARNEWILSEIENNGWA